MLVLLDFNYTKPYYPDRMNQRAHRESGMTKLLEEAVATVRCLPPEMQDHIARAMLAFASEESGEVYILTPEEVAAIAEAEAEIARGEGIGGKKLQAFWRSLGV